MNNEEKILELLEKLTEKVDSMDGRLDRLEITQEEQGKVLADQGKLLEEIDQRSIKTQVLLETEVRDNIKLLFDGQAHIQETLKELKPAPRLEVLESDVSVLKAAVKANSSRIAELEKAQ